MKARIGFGSAAGNLMLYVLLSVAAAVCVFPFLYVLGQSFTTEAEIVRRGVVIIPEQFTVEAYRRLFGGYGLGQAYKMTLFRTSVGTALNLVLTAMTAYGLSKRYLPGRSGLLLYVIFTMLFSGGLIPTFILVKSLGLLNSVWVMIVPGLISAFNVVVMKGFFEQLPVEIEESAKVDGAGEMTVLRQIILPLSLPIFATIGLFYAVAHWNSYFDAVMYINKANLMPLQVVLRNILLNFQLQHADQTTDEQPVSIIAIQMAAVIASTLPILLVYPFIQKHFTKGVLLGSVKG